MSRKFKFSKDYYKDGINIYQKGTAEIQLGVTVLVGCNGSGKSTFLNIIKEDLSEKHIPCLTFDNLKDGGDRAREMYGFMGNMNLLASSLLSSEGENIVMNIGKLAECIGTFIRSKGEKSLRRIRHLHDSDINVNSTELWIVLDAADSGLSIDNVIDVKDLFSLVLSDTKNKGYEVYIVVSANEYEMCVDEKCFDVQKMKYVDVKSYDDYKKTVMESRIYKDSLR